MLNSAPAADRAELHSEAQLGARAFLAAIPHGACRMEPAVFLVELRRRLRIPDAAADVWCPRCDGVLDTHSRHAGMCSAGGDRTRCHHAARNLVAAWADRAGLQPEVEKPDLLLPQRPDEVRLASRRPADVYLPAWDGSPTALDLAITGPTRSETLATACQEPLAAASAYAAFKSSHLHTAQTCASQGVRFQQGSATRGPGSPALPSCLLVLPGLLLCVRELPLQLYRTSCYRSCVLPSAPVMVGPYFLGGPCPRPRLPSPT